MAEHRVLIDVTHMRGTRGATFALLDELDPGRDPAVPVIATHMATASGSPPTTSRTT